MLSVLQRSTSSKMAMVDVYLEVGGVIIMVALSVCVVYLGLRLRSVNSQKVTAVHLSTMHSSFSLAFGWL